MTTTDTKQQHTAGRLRVRGTPWEHTLVIRGDQIITAQGGATIWEAAVRIEYAHDIVRCVNAHDELLDALIEIGHMTLCNPDKTPRHEMERDIRAVVLTALVNAQFPEVPQQPPPNTETT